MIFASVFIIQGLEMRKLCLLIALMVSLFTHISTLADGVETCGVENMPAAIKIMISYSHWSNREMPGWINPRGLQSANPERNNIEAEIAPLLFGTNQKIAVSGFKIYDNIAGNLYCQVQWAASVRVSGVSSGYDVPDTQESVGLE